MAGRQLQPLIGINLEADLARDAINIGVEQITLTGLWRNTVALCVKRATHMPGTQADGVVHLVIAARHIVLHLTTQTRGPQSGKRRYAGYRGFGNSLALGPAGANGHNAACRAAAVNSAAATQHLNLFNIGRIDVGQIARRISVGIHRHAIDQHQHIAPAQCLAVVSDGVTGIRHAGYRLAQHGGQTVRAMAQSLNLLALQRRHLPHWRGQIALRAARDCHFLQGCGLLLGVCGPRSGTGSH